MGRYAQGRRFEYQVRDELLDHGFVCMRSAGSKGSIDIMAGKEGLVLAVQCKRDGRLPQWERDRLMRDSHHFGAVPVLAVASRGVLLYLIPKTGKVRSEVNVLRLMDHG